MQKLGRVEATRISKEQAPKQPPMKIIQSIPTNAEIANMNPKSMIFDEANGILHIKGNKKSWKFQGVPE